MGDGKPLTAAFVKLAELAEVQGAVPEDGSGIDGVWTVTVPDPDTGEPWHVAMNADVDEERTATLPDPHGDVDVPAAHAVVFYGVHFGPVAMLSPHGGRTMVDGRHPDVDEEGTFERRTEDQFIKVLDHAIRDARPFQCDLCGEALDEHTQTCPACGVGKPEPRGDDDG